MAVFFQNSPIWLWLNNKWMRFGFYWRDGVLLNWWGIAGRLAFAHEAKVNGQCKNRWQEKSKRGLA